MKLLCDLKQSLITFLLSFRICTHPQASMEMENEKNRKPFTNAVQMQVGFIIIQNDPGSKPEVVFKHFYIK